MEFNWDLLTNLNFIGVFVLINLVIFAIIYLFLDYSRGKTQQKKEPFEQIINKKEDKKLKDKNNKNNKKSVKKTSNKDEQQIKNENKSFKNNEQLDKQSSKKASFGISGDELDISTSSKNKQSEKSNSCNKSIENFVDSSTVSKQINNQNSSEKQKKNQSPDHEDKKQMKTTPKQIKKKEQQADKQQHAEIEKPIENLDTSSFSQLSSSQLNLEVDISFAKLVDIIKTVPLSNEEIQVIIDALLCKNTESGWINKNDPITVLKKQLEEKELELKNETENHDRAKARITMMRDEFNLEKQKYISYKEQAKELNTKIQQLEGRLQKFEEYKQEEISRLQLNYSKIQKKIAEDLQRKLQEEQSRAQQAVNQLESEKAKQNVLSFQLIQLNNERQQFDGINSNLEKMNEELKNENQSLKEAISQMKNELEIKEYNYKKQLCEKDESYKNMIGKIEEKSKELDSNAANAVLLQNKLDKLTSEFVNEQLTVNLQLKELKNEKKSLVKLFKEITNINDEDKLLDEVKILVTNYKSSIDQQSNIKEESKKLKDRLNEEVKKSSELEKKVKHFEDTLINAERELDKIGKTADVEFRNWNQRIEKSEKAYQEISKEHEKLCNEKKEIEKKMKQFDGKIEINA